MSMNIAEEKHALVEKLLSLQNRCSDIEAEFRIDLSELKVKM